jgi:hypothetical protein
LDEYIDLPEGAPKDFPVDIFEAKTKAWKQPRKSYRKNPENKRSSKSIRISKILASNFAINKLVTVTPEEDALSDVERIFFCEKRNC